MRMNEDGKVLRRLGREWSLLAGSQEMGDREEVWTRLHDLDPIRPAIIVETELMSDFVKPEELECEDAFLRTVERTLREGIKHVRLLEDDYVLRNEFRLDYRMTYENPDYGVGLQYVVNSDTHAVVTNHPIQSVGDIKRMKSRRAKVELEVSHERKKHLEDLLDGTLEVVLQHSAYNLPQLSKYTFDLIGMDNLYFWLVDEPEAVSEIVGRIKDDYVANLKMLESQGLLSRNDRNQIAGSGSYGYVSGLYGSTDGKTRLSDLWVWMESQETTTISPDMFEEVFLAPMGEIARLFGLVYYGCCEQLHDRFERIEKYIGNIRSVSVSPWSDHRKMGELLKGRYVFSKKPTPQYISMPVPDVRAQEEEIRRTLESADGHLVEFVYRDVYEFQDNPQKFQNWIRRVRSHIG